MSSVLESLPGTYSWHKRMAGFPTAEPSFRFLVWRLQVMVVEDTALLPLQSAIRAVATAVRSTEGVSKSHAETRNLNLLI